MRVRIIGLAAAACVFSFSAPAVAATTVSSEYYVATEAYQGKPENLWEIADRFLGDSGRAGEILALNAGRVQPDGERLTQPGKVKSGWRLALPWDAAGPGLRTGQIPVSTGKDSSCDHTAATPADDSWSQRALTPGQVWNTANGDGITVAVIGSGVDGAAAALAGRVVPGTDLTTGTGRGDQSCTGTGTALAGLVAGTGYGIAPGARIVPVRTAKGRLDAAAAVTALRVAAHTGAQVILVGADIDGTDAAVGAAVGEAIAGGAVVVAPAADGVAATEGLLRVGASTKDKQPASTYAAGTTDLLAPGASVASVDGDHSGEPFAAAIVAGTVALVRSEYPALAAADTTRQVTGNATGGVVSPVSAVITPLAAGTGTSADPVTPHSSLSVLSQVLFWVATGLAALLLLIVALYRPYLAMTGAAGRRRDRRQAMATRAQVSESGDDAFWDAPVAQQDSTQIIPRIR